MRAHGPAKGVRPQLPGDSASGSTRTSTEVANAEVKAQSDAYYPLA